MGHWKYELEAFASNISSIVDETTFDIKSFVGKSQSRTQQKGSPEEEGRRTHLGLKVPKDSRD